MATAAPQAPRKTSMKFRLLHGLHTIGRQQDSVRLDSLKQQLEEGLITQEKFDTESAGLRPRRIFHVGEIIESRTDLLRLNGPHPMVPKFARAEDDVAAMIPPPYQTPDTKPTPFMGEDTLTGMSLSQLKKMARAEEVDISGLTTEQEIADRIRQAMDEME